LAPQFLREAKTVERVSGRGQAVELVVVFRTRRRLRLRHETKQSVLELSEVAKKKKSVWRRFYRECDNTVTQSPFLKVEIELADSY
jgi:hypothetical protein